MFVLSVRASTLKFTAVMTLGVVLVTLLVIFLPASDSGLPVSGSGAVVYEKVETVGDMARFLRQFGIECADSLYSDREVTLPEEFEGVFAEYNNLQKSQGLDLSEFAGKKLRKVILRAKRQGEEEECFATLFIYRGTVVGGDLSSTDPNGKVSTFARPSGAAGG